MALSYRHALETYASAHPEIADVVEGLDNRWTEYGANWVRPTSAPLDLDAWLTDAEMAELFGQEAKTVYAWGRRGRIRVHTIDGARRYNVGDVVSYQQSRRLRRTG